MQEKTDEQVASEGLDRMEDWMEETELVTEGMLEGIAAGSPAIDGSYRTLSQGEIVEILKQSM